MRAVETWREQCCHNPECPTESQCRALDQRAALPSAPPRFPAELLSVLERLVGELQRQAVQLRVLGLELAARARCDVTQTLRAEALLAEAAELERRASAVALAVARLDP